MAKKATKRATRKPRKPKAPAKKLKGRRNGQALAALKSVVLDHLAVCGNVSQACREAGCDRRMHYVWLHEDDDYATRAQGSWESYADRLEEEARKRAIDGVKRYKFHKGDPILHPETKEPYFEHYHSDTLLIFLLKGHRPEKYADRVEQTTRGEVLHTHEVSLIRQLAVEIKSDAGYIEHQRQVEIKKSAQATVPAEQ